jgi:hypothetical protein
MPYVKLYIFAQVSVYMLSPYIKMTKFKTNYVKNMFMFCS